MLFVIIMGVTLGEGSQQQPMLYWNYNKCHTRGIPAAWTKANWLVLDLIILVFAKAFDTVPHRQLLSKLEMYCLGTVLIEWIRIWLTTRTQSVVLDGVASQPAPARSGVPQGAVLGPLLFLLFVNNIREKIDSQIKLSADDCFLFRTIEGKSDCDCLQQALDKLYKRTESNLMHFNVRK